MFWAPWEGGERRRNPRPPRPPGNLWNARNYTAGSSGQQTGWVNQHRPRTRAAPPTGVRSSSPAAYGRRRPHARRTPPAGVRRAHGGDVAPPSGVRGVGFGAPPTGARTVLPAAFGRCRPHNVPGRLRACAVVGETRAAYGRVRDLGDGTPPKGARTIASAASGRCRPSGAAPPTGVRGAGDNWQPTGARAVPPTGVRGVGEHWQPTGARAAPPTGVRGVGAEASCTSVRQRGLRPCAAPRSAVVDGRAGIGARTAEQAGTGDVTRSCSRAGRRVDVMCHTRTGSDGGCREATRSHSDGGRARGADDDVSGKRKQ
jgi:hypothetical protein